MNMLVFLFLIPAAPAAKKAFAEEEPSATTKKVKLNRISVSVSNKVITMMMLILLASMIYYDASKSNFCSTSKQNPEIPHITQLDKYIYLFAL